MQTFLPYEDFTLSAKVLDSKRLGKQRVEAFQILKALHDPTYGWQSHPAVKMWRNSTGWLYLYYLTICKEWLARGYKHTMPFSTEPWTLCLEETKSPSWLGRADFHSSHRAALLWKNPSHYAQFNWTEKPELNYVWPI